MARPPLYPIQTAEGKKMNYFQDLVTKAYQYLKEDGITLSFEGYTETILEYSNLKESDKEKAWELARDLNAWSEYFSSLANLLQKEYLDAMTDKQSTQALASFKADQKKVANGDRLSNKDPDVIFIRKKRNVLKALYDELEAKVKFLERAHYHCKATYDWSQKNPPMNQNQYNSQNAYNRGAV